MSDPTPIRDLAPELARALDADELDPPEGVEDLVWKNLESTLGTSPQDAATTFDDAPAHAPARGRE